MFIIKTLEIGKSVVPSTTVMICALNSEKQNNTQNKKNIFFILLKFN
jgi:hypothetical protein